MQVVNGDRLNSNPKQLKFIFNASAISFGSYQEQHKNIAGAGLKYQDNGGNAIAGLIVTDHIEIRGHSVLKPSAETIKQRWADVLKSVGETGRKHLASFDVYFMGKKIIDKSPPEVELT